MNKELSFLKEFIDEINKTNSNLDKQSVIKKYYELDKDLFYKLMNYTYDFHFKYYLTSSNILKREDLNDDNDEELTLFEMLNRLNNRVVTGYDAIKMVNNYLNKNLEFKELILRVIDKDLKCRIDAKTLNKVIPNMIPTFDVSLGEKFDIKRFDWNVSNWFASRKLDGIRCIYQHKYNNFVSRQGEEFWTLNELKSSIDTIKEFLKGYVLDGELSLITENGADDFQGIMKQIRKKNHNIKNIRYNVFDIIPQEDFDNKESSMKFSERYSKLIELKEILESTGHIKIVEQIKIDSEEMFNSLKQKAVENNWEGLMLRKDDVYKGKRSFDLLKYKEFSDAEYVVDSIETGIKPMLIDGIMKDIECVAAIHFKHKGYDVKCGSGMNDNQRIEWLKNPESIIGKTVKIKYFEETTDQNGNLSLRFPILLTVYENGRFD